MKKKKENSAEREERMPLGRRNYLWMVAGLALIVVGFALMAGGGSDDSTVFNADMFSFRRVTLAPIVVVAGFAVEIYAIMSRRG